MIQGSFGHWTGVGAFKRGGDFSPDKAQCSCLFPTSLTTKICPQPRGRQGSGRWVVGGAWGESAGPSYGCI